MKTYIKLFSITILFAAGILMQSCDLSSLDPNSGGSTGGGTKGGKDTTFTPVDTTIHHGNGGKGNGHGGGPRDTIFNPNDSLKHHGNGDGGMGGGNKENGDSLKHFGKDSLNPKDTGKVHMMVKLPYHQSFAIPQIASTVTFADLTGDSRCPKNVTCVWAGNAAPNFTLTNSKTGEVTSFVLNTNSAPNFYENENYRITLVQLDPYPMNENGSIWSPEPYFATLDIQIK